VEALAVVTLAIGTVLVFLVPALFWSAIIASLYQIVRDKMRARLKQVARKVTVVLSVKRTT
jgi:hypothetical protein